MIPLTFLFPIGPTMVHYMIGCIERSRKILSHKSKNLKNFVRENYSLSKSKNLKSFETVFRLNKNVFENAIQTPIILIIIALLVSSTNTVSIFDKTFKFLFEKKTLKDLLPESNEYVLLLDSFTISLFSMISGQMQRHSYKANHCISLRGKIIIGSLDLLSVFGRMLAVLIFFAPPMGLFNLLGHWKLGRLPANSALKNPWKKIDFFTDLTVWKLNVYSYSFLALIVSHFLMTTVMKYCYAIELYSRKDSVSKKIYHIFAHLIFPSSYKDWDEEVSSVEDVKTNWGKVSKEMKLILALFAFEHIIMCTPIWILSYNISVRNRYSIVYFPK